MKRLLTQVLLSLTLAALALTATAQGRHDEKPHGMKSTEQAAMVEPKVHPGGRHDVASHKSAIAASKKGSADKKSAATGKAEPGKTEVGKGEPSKVEAGK